MWVIMVCAALIMVPAAFSSEMSLHKP